MKMKWINYCNETIPQALRYLADNERPIGGEDRFNSIHLYQLADEFESSLKLQSNEDVEKISFKKSPIQLIDCIISNLENTLSRKEIVGNNYKELIVALGVAERLRVLIEDMKEKPFEYYKLESI